VFGIEFTLACHFFCNYGCAVGVVQSLVWMGNKHAMVVGLNRSRVSECVDCDSSCEHACPMRLKPRSIKRKMFTCTQCMQCIQSCEQVSNLLSMVENYVHWMFQSEILANALKFHSIVLRIEYLKNYLDINKNIHLTYQSNKIILIFIFFVKNA